MNGKKTGGREKGSPNTLTRELIELAETLDVDPFAILLRFASGDHVGLGIGPIDPALQAKAAAEACQYLYPKRKSIEHSTSDDGFRIIIEDYVKK